MQNQTTNTKLRIEKNRTEFDLLQQLDLLESEFRLIENEYRKRHEELICRLEMLNKQDTILLSEN
jgi:hypothetical protein